MTKTIWKFPFEISGWVAIEMPIGAQVLHVETQPARALLGKPYLWALVDPEAPKEVREFWLFGTGHPIADQFNLLRHIGTFMKGAFVWHMFESAKE